MASPILYDIRRVLTSKSVLILMALMIFLSFFLISSFTLSTTSTTETSLNTQLLSWYDTGGNYHFLGFAFNQQGQPVSGVPFQVNFTTPSSPSSPNICPTTSTYGSTSVQTDANGVANLSFTAPISADYSVCLTVTQPGGFPETEGPFLAPYANALNSTSGVIPPGQVVGIPNNSPFNELFLGNTGVQQAIGVDWAGAYGAVPTNYALYYKFINDTEECVSQNGGVSCYTNVSNEVYNLTESAMQPLYNMSGYYEVLKLPPIPADITANSSTLALGLFYPNGTAVGSIGTFGTDGLYVPQNVQVSVPEGESIVLGFFQGIFGLFIPLVAILGSYNSYGKDRTSGVLESVLAQPISRRDLSLSRFVSSFLAMAVATSIAMGVVDGVFRYYTGQFLDTNLLLVSAGAFFVELAAFIALMMLFSRLIRSSGLLVGIGIGIFLLFAIFWDIVIALVQLAINPRSIGSNQPTVIGEFLNPAQFISLVDTYITHTLSTGGIFGGGFGLPISPSDYGITIFSLVATAVLWIGLPLAGFLYLAIKKD